MNFKQNIIQYVIGIFTSCREKIIALEKKIKKYQAKINSKHLM